MQVRVLDPGAFAHARVRLEPGESFVSEAGAMFRMDPVLDLDVTVRTGGRGGVWTGLGRMLGGDSFFLSTYTATTAPGEVSLAPVLPGELRVLDGTSADAWTCTGGSFLGCGPEIVLEPRFQGLKGLVSGERLFFLEARGPGPLIVAAFGALRAVELQGELTVDTGHLVAFESGISYRIGKAGGSWVQSFLGGERLVLHLEGRGRLLLQSHAPPAFGRALGRLLPPREG